MVANNENRNGQEAGAPCELKTLKQDCAEPVENLFGQGYPQADFPPTLMSKGCPPLKS
jgi:hypothetical protein